MIEIQKNRNPVAEDFVQPENQIYDTEDINMDINKNHVPSTQKFMNLTTTNKKLSTNIIKIEMKV